MTTYAPHPIVAREMGVAGNNDCVCPTPMQAMFCPYGHMTECHYPKTCDEAQCSHYLRQRDAET